MAAASQTAVGDRGKERRLASLKTPWVDRTIAAIAVIPLSREPLAATAS